MEKISMPSDHSHVVFFDQQGLRHVGIYRKTLHAFVEVVAGGSEENLENAYSEDEITSWDYQEKDKNPDADIMVIL